MAPGAEHPAQRYATAAMTRLLASERRAQLWRQLWIALAECQSELGLPITAAQLDSLRRAQPAFDAERSAALERETRHDVVAHLRHFAEQAGEAGGILHLGATSAFITDNSDLLTMREALELLARRLTTTLQHLGDFARRTRQLPTLAYTHFQPAQLTTMGKRACLWAQDLLRDLDEIRHRHASLLCRGAKGTTGTQASFLALFGGDHQKVRELDRRLATRLGFSGSWPITGQTYPRKQDSQILQALAGIGESAHKLGSDLRLLQGTGELAEPFGSAQVGSSAMAYKRNPVLAERMCGLARRLLVDSLNGPLNAGTQWLERSLDDSSNRRLVLHDSFLLADGILNVAGAVARGLVVHEGTVRARVQRELPFMATEAILMAATLRGGNRQNLHERLRRLSLAAQERVQDGGENPLLDDIAADESFRMGREEIAALLDPQRFTGRATQQVEEFLTEVLEPSLAGAASEPIEELEV
jgi:adenylosuccinate lyase